MRTAILCFSCLKPTESSFSSSSGCPTNTICENGLIAAYAQRLPGVTPEIIEYVAKELRLDVVCSPVAERVDKSKEMDLQRAINTLLDLYASMKKPVASEPDAGGPVDFEMSEHEPSI